MTWRQADDDLRVSPDPPVQVVSWIYLGLDTLVYLGTAGLGSLNRHDTFSISQDLYN